MLSSRRASLLPRSVKVWWEDRGGRTAVAAVQWARLLAGHAPFSWQGAWKRRRGAWKARALTLSYV